jgi:hypothetical protein
LEKAFCLPRKNFYGNQRGLGIFIIRIFRVVASKSYDEHF